MFAGLSAGVWLVLDANWRLLLIGLCLLGLLGGSVVWLGGSGEAMETHEVGALTLTMAGPEVASDDHPDIDLPGDGVYPLMEGASIEVQSRFDHADGMLVDGDEVTLTVARVITRETTHGTLWRDRSIVGVERGSNALELTTSIDLEAVLSRASDIDASLQTRSGSVVVEVEAVITGLERIDRPLVASSTIEPIGDFISFDPGVREPLHEHKPVSRAPPRWALFVVPISAVGVAVIIAVVSVGIVPLDPRRRRSYRYRWIRWYYRRYLIEVPVAFELGDATAVDHPSALVRLAKRTDRPVCVDPQGVLTLSLDDATFVWSTTPPFKSEDEQMGRSTCP